MPMGSSNMDVVTTGDIEAQLHNPKWFIDHKHMLRPNQEREVNELGYFILKVPQSRRKLPQKFSPYEWRFGLHNRENLDTRGSEAVKLGLALQYGLVGDEWDHFCDGIVDDPKAMLACYGLHDGVSTWINIQIKHVLALDALFLATKIDEYFPINERQLLTPNLFELLPFGFHAIKMFLARNHILMRIAHHDLYQVENQIPFVLIDKVVKYFSNFIASQTSKDHELVLDALQYQQKSLKYVAKAAINDFMDTSSEVFKIDNLCLLDEKTHILGAAYKVICGSEGIKLKSKKRNAYIHIDSAKKLEHSGIKIVGVDGPLCTMSYKKNCLSLPKMRIFDDTISFIRNMAWYEMESIEDGVLFHDYILFMSDLIQAPEDLDLLVKHGVIYNACGTKAFEMWTSLREGLTQIGYSEKHHKVKVDIESKCDHRRYRLWSEFHITFCSKPWLVLSTIAIVLVTLATLVQTYISVIGSNKMKPKFS